ncbi:hypothetical protein [Pseudooceanicola atlanticus]|uniref:hypothetical protein n=1 Tax=Pseudooceanicola atlanticus TaxID=1461694 RepID=UPI0023567EB1|nr:hypothetical protein [Pseudooceanicola atlanticus]
MSKSSVIEILDKLDEEIILARLNVKPRSIRLARERGMFPAKWYPVIRDLCAEGGLDCPDGVFNFASPSLASSKEAS